MNPIVQRVFALMEKFNISAAALSREISLSNGLLTQWKQGKQIPSLEAITKIAKYFNVSIDYLVTGEDYSTPSEERYISLAQQLTGEETLTSLKYLCVRVKILCDATGMSYNELEEATGIGKNAITNWSKIKSLPSGNEILGIAKYFDVSMDYLTGNSDNPKSHKDSKTLVTDLIKLLDQLSTTSQEFRRYLVGYLSHVTEK